MFDLSIEDELRHHEKQLAWAESIPGRLEDLANNSSSVPRMIELLRTAQAVLPRHLAVAGGEPFTSLWRALDRKVSALQVACASEVQHVVRELARTREAKRDAKELRLARVKSLGCVIEEWRWFYNTIELGQMVLSVRFSLDDAALALRTTRLQIFADCCGPVCV